MTQHSSSFRQLLAEKEQKRQKEIDQKLENEFEHIRDGHSKALLKISARVVLGSSVIRVFQKRTKRRLKAVLENINVDDLPKIETQDDYQQWFEGQLSKIAEEIQAANPKNTTPRIYPGYKWGHAAKVLNLFVREVVEYKRYFSEVEAARIRKWLYVPIDSLAIRKLKSLGVNLPFDRINGVDTQEKFYDIQDQLGRAANNVDVPRIWFDDMWGDRLEDEE